MNVREVSASHFEDIDRGERYDEERENITDRPQLSVAAGCGGRGRDHVPLGEQREKAG